MSEQIGIAALLRQLRTERGDSLREAARNLNVDVAHLARVEKGEKSPSLDLQHRASNYYKADPDALALAADRLPEDVVRLLLDRPELIRELRANYGDHGEL
jgi:transcriptional regulator with XRE-family HTH domain